MQQKLKVWLRWLRARAKRRWKELCGFLVFLAWIADYLQLIDLQSVIGWFVKDEHLASSIAGALSFIMLLLKLAANSGALEG